MFYLLFIILGGIWGSFSNVCIYRLPENKGIIAGRSFCPSCKNKIQWFESNEKLAPKKNKKGVAHAIANTLVQNPVLISPILFATAILNKSANPILIALKIPKTILTTIDLSNKFTHPKLIH